MLNLSGINFKGTNYYRPEDLKFKINKDIRDALLREMEDEKSPFYVWFNNFLDSELTTPFSLFLRGYSYEYKSNYVEALDFYNKALNIKSHPNILLHKARCFYKSDLKDSVLNTLNEALKHEQTGELFYEKGNILYEHEKDYNRALECFNNSLKYNKNDVRVLKGKADCLYKLGNHEEGKKHLDMLNKNIQQESDIKLSALIKGKKVDVEVLDKDLFRIAKKAESEYFYISRYFGNTVVLGIKSFLKSDEYTNEMFSSVVGDIFELNKKYNPEENPFIRFRIIKPAIFYWNEYDGRGHILEKGKAEIIDERYDREKLKTKTHTNFDKDRLSPKPKVGIKHTIRKNPSNKSILKVLLIIFIPLLILTSIIILTNPSLFNIQPDNKDELTNLSNPQKDNELFKEVMDSPKDIVEEENNVIDIEEGDDDKTDDDETEKENNVTYIEEGDDDKTDDDETETVDDESETAHDEEKIITPEGVIITDIGSINEVKTKNPPDKWMLQTGNNKIPIMSGINFAH